MNHALYTAGLIRAGVRERDFIFRSSFPAGGAAKLSLLTKQHGPPGSRSSLGCAWRFGFERAIGGIATPPREGAALVWFVLVNALYDLQARGFPNAAAHPL